MRILELFSGSGSIGQVFRSEGWEVVSLDSDVKTDAVIKADILEWDPSVFPVGHFDVVWASPCCTQYSCARRGAKTPRNLDLADSLVKRSLEIIAYFEPRVWFIENPETGLLKTRPFMEGLPFSDVDYCCFSEWGYRKRTRIWTNSGFTGKLCLGGGQCPNMVGARHRTTAQQGRNNGPTGLYGEHLSTKQLYKLPPNLCQEIEALSRALVTTGVQTP